MDMMARVSKKLHFAEDEDNKSEKTDAKLISKALKKADKEA